VCEAAVQAIVETQAILKADTSLALKSGEGLFPGYEASLIPKLISCDLAYSQPVLCEIFIED